MTTPDDKFKGIKYYDNHTLYIKCSVTNQQQLSNALSKAIIMAKKITNSNIDPRFKINMVKNSQNEFIGIAYVRVKDPKIYHMLLGRNPDGSERFEERYDREWREPTQEEIDAVDYQISLIPTPSEHPDWEKIQDDWGKADYMECTYEKLVGDLRKALYPQKITVKLDPLIQLEPYRLDANQKERYKSWQTIKNSDNPDFDPSKLVIPETLPFTVECAASVKLNVKQSPHILKCVNVPSYITPSYLKQMFTPFVSDCETLYHWKVMGVVTDEPYPYVHIDSKRTASIIFDSQTHDAEFALFLTKRSEVSGTDKNGNKLTNVLWFGHSFIVDRDVPKEITKLSRPQPFQHNKAINKPMSNARGTRHNKI